MIPIDLSTLIYVILLTALFVLGGVWIGGELIRHLRERKNRYEILTCPLCGLDFYDEGKLSEADCPQCGSKVDRISQRKSTV